MKNVIITVGSVTYAIKLGKLLRRGGIESKLIKVEGNENDRGCTHAVEISERDFYGAVAIMKASGIEYSVYKDKK